MPFIAKFKDTNQEINILDYEYPRLELKKGCVVCRFCEQEMYVRGGKDRDVDAHFAHYPKRKCTANNIDYREDQYPESPGHLLMKRVIADELKSEFSLYSEANPQFEYVVPINGENRKRIIDVAMVFPMGWIIAHEVQLSKISIDVLEKRTEDYEREGIDVVWWFGNEAFNDDIKEWSFRKFGSVFTIDTEKLKIRVSQNKH